MNYETILNVIEAHILTITLNRPKRMNALTVTMTNERAPVSTALIRQMMYRNSALPHPLTAHKIESLGMFYVSLGNGKEGVDAFLGKRAPRFTVQASEMPDFYPWWL